MNQTTSELTYAVLGMEVEYFHGIKRAEFELDRAYQWIFLTGENGFGKTSCLQGLAIALVGFSDHIAHQYGYGLKQSSNIEKKEKFIFKKYIASLKERDTIIRVDALSDSVFRIPIAAYGSVRLNVSEYEGSKPTSPIQGLFESTSILQNIEYELSRWFLKKDDVEFKTKYEQVTKILKQLLPNLADIQIDRKTDKVTYIEKDAYEKRFAPVTINQLAAGYRSIIAMIGDMILRLFKTQPEVHDPKELAGIVIIDEIDLHFHPNIQRQLPALLSKIFPKVQFIASTHSPIPILGAPKKSAFLTVERNAEEGITIKTLNHVEVKRLTPNTILTSPIFGFTEILAETNNGNLRVKTETLYDDIKFNEEVERRLAEYAKEEDGEFDGMFN